eukprot:scaffold144698_cov24-Tisochrysis_lutea.AAC.1
MWQSELPVVWTIPATPCLETERKAWAAEAARTASAAVAAEPTVPLNPTGVDRPEASCRWSAEATVGEPIADHET